MSVIQTKSQNWTVREKSDVIALYEGPARNPNLPGDEPKIGLEIELNFYKQDTLAPLTEMENCRFVCKGERRSIRINNEPSATTLEIITEPFARAEFSGLKAQLEERFAELWSLSRENNAFPSPFGYLPHVTPAQHHPNHTERYIAFWIPPRPDLQDAFLSFLDPSIQVSVSYRDWDHLLRIVRLSVALEPFLILTTEADAGWYEGAAVSGSPRTRILGRRGRNGGIPDFYFTARSGEEFIDAHIAHCLHNQHMFVCFDHNGKLGKLPDNVWASFAELEDLGFGPRSLLNYRQAQSESWRRAVNVAEIRDGEGTLFGHRAEVASLFCTGLQHQRSTAAVMSYLLAYCDTFYGNVSSLLKDFGIDLENLTASRALLEQNFESAHMHRGQYFDLPFGTGTLKDFARRFAQAFGCCLNDVALKSAAAPLLRILETGRPDWLVNRETFTSLEDQKRYLAAFPALTREHPELIAADKTADDTKDIVRSVLKHFS